VIQLQRSHSLHVFIGLLIKHYLCWSVASIAEHMFDMLVRLLVTQ